MLVSSSDGFLRDSLFAAILLRALMVAVVGVREVEKFKAEYSTQESFLESRDLA